VSEATRAEVCAVAVAEAFRGDGEVLASSFGRARNFSQASGSFTASAYSRWNSSSRP
jgi:hypothetical protein